MNRRNRTVRASIAVSAMLFAMPASAELQRADVEAIVRDYFAAHPEAVERIVRDYLVEESRATARCACGTDQTAHAGHGDFNQFAKAGLDGGNSQQCQAAI